MFVNEDVAVKGTDVRHHRTATDRGTKVDQRRFGRTRPKLQEQWDWDQVPNNQLNTGNLSVATIYDVQSSLILHNTEVRTG